MLCFSVPLGDRVGRGRGARRSKGPSGAPGNFGAGRGAALVVVGRQFIVAGPDIEPRNAYVRQSHSNVAVSVLDDEMTVRMLAFELLLPPPRFSTRRVFAF
jgi:hypothetical protein